MIRRPLLATILLASGAIQTASGAGGEKRLAGRFVVLECVTEGEADRDKVRFYNLDGAKVRAAKLGYKAYVIHTSDVKGFAPKVYAAIVGPFPDVAAASRAQKRLKRLFPSSYVKRGVWNGEQCGPTC